MISERMAEIHSDIRGDLYEESIKMQNEGKTILKLNTGNPGVFGFKMPESVKKSMLENIDLSVPYCDFRGMSSARKSICDYHKQQGIKNISEDDVYITNGVSEGVNILCLSLLNSGDEVLLPTPCYSLWSNSVRLASANPKFYYCDENNNWNPDIDDIKSKITKKTKAILLINPNNPTGAVYSKDTVLEILKLASKHNLLVFSDEIYDRLVYPEYSFVSTAAIATDDLTVITTNGLSKSHLICGMRCGWFVISGPQKNCDEIKFSVNKMCAMRLCANSLMQTVIPFALEDEKSTKSMILPGGRLYEQRKASMDILKEIQGVSCVSPQAAFYCFPKIDDKVYPVFNDHEFCLNLLHNQSILVVPGSAFEYNNHNHFRIVMLPEKDILADAVKKIEIELLKQLKSLCHNHKL